MADSKLTLMAHLMRRAGFGAARDELDAYVSKGYEATVEELVHPNQSARCGPRPYGAVLAGI